MHEAKSTAKDPEASRTLVADDDDVTRSAIVAILQQMGCYVDVAEDGAEAVQLARVGVYDLILLDGEMPNETGIEATQEIRQLGGDTRNTPIIGLSGHRHITEEACRAAGMNDFVRKPFGVATLRQAVAKWLHPQTDRQT